MNESNCIDLSFFTVEEQPFPHFSSASAFNKDTEVNLFEWFENTTEWDLTQTDFYQQYEFNLLNTNLPATLQCLVNESTIAAIKEKLKDIFNVESFELVGVTAHKLISGQRIGIHNDFINGDETHRLIIQINKNWKEENGGFLILFGSPTANDISEIINPINNSAVGFEISSRSHHAVSKIYDFSRYTVVYTFRKR